MSFASAFESIPPVTRTLLVATAGITLPCLLGFLHPSQVALSWWRVGSHYEVWRPFTSFFFGGSGFPLLYDVFLIYRNSSAMERDTFKLNTAEYAWMHLMLGVFILTYIWCRSNPTMKVSIFGLLTIPTSLYPPALILLDLLTGGPGKALGGIIGMVSGHAWWFVSTYLPSNAPAHLRRTNPFSAPTRFVRLFSSHQAAPVATSWGSTLIPNGSRSAESSATTSQHRWGGGQKLGGTGL